MDTLVLRFRSGTGLARRIFFGSLVPRLLNRVITENEIKGGFSSASQFLPVNWTQLIELSPICICTYPGSLCRYLFVVRLFLGFLLDIVAAFVAISSFCSA